MTLDDLDGKARLLSDVCEALCWFRLGARGFYLSQANTVIAESLLSPKRPFGYVAVRKYRENMAHNTWYEGWQFRDVLDNHLWLHLGARYDGNRTDPFFTFTINPAVQEIFDLERVARKAAMAAYLETARSLCSSMI